MEMEHPSPIKHKENNDNTAKMVNAENIKKSYEVQNLKTDEKITDWYINNKTNDETWDKTPKHEKAGTLNLTTGSLNSERVMNANEYNIFLDPKEIENVTETATLGFKNVKWKMNYNTTGKILLQANLYRGNNGRLINLEPIPVFIKIEPKYDNDEDEEHQIATLVFDTFHDNLANNNVIKSYHYLEVDKDKIPNVVEGIEYDWEYDEKTKKPFKAKIKIFEMIEGSNLFQLMPGSLADPLFEYSSIVFQLLYMLASLEKINVLHFDLKLDNIMLTQSINATMKTKLQREGFQLKNKNTGAYSTAPYNESIVVNSSKKIWQKSHQRFLNRYNSPDEEKKVLTLSSTTVMGTVYTLNVPDEEKPKEKTQLSFVTRTSGLHKIPILIDYGLSKIIKKDGEWYEHIAYTLHNRPPEFFFHRSESVLGPFNLKFTEINEKGEEIIKFAIVKDKDLSPVLALKNHIYDADTGAVWVSPKTDRFAMGMMIMEILQDKYFYEIVHAETNQMKRQKLLRKIYQIKSTGTLSRQIMVLEENDLLSKLDEETTYHSFFIETKKTVIQYFIDISEQMNSLDERWHKTKRISHPRSLAWARVIIDGPEQTFLYLWSLVLIMGLPHPNAVVRKTKLYQMMIKPYEEFIMKSQRYDYLKNLAIPQHEKKLINSLLDWEPDFREDPILIIKNAEDNLFSVLKPIDSNFRYTMSLDNLDRLKVQKSMLKEEEKDKKKKKREEDENTEEKRRKLKTKISNNFNTGTVNSLKRRINIQLEEK